MSIDADVEVLIAGAGPHGLAVALHLIDADERWRASIAVVDPRGWLGAWDEQFARLDIAHLRSPAVHHPGPDASDLTRWTTSAGHRSERPYGLPSTDAFRAYVDHLVDEAGLDEAVTPTRLHRLGVRDDEVTALLGDGTTVRCRHVVLATNPARRRIPSWAFDALPVAPDTLTHAGDVDLRGLDLTGEHVVVIGGGLTAGHLVVGAVARGARVTMLARRPLRTSMFDTDPGWLGPKELDGFDAIDDPLERLHRCRDARNGGSLPPWMIRRVKALAAKGDLDLRAPARVCGAHVHGTGLSLMLGDETTLVADRVWLATGTEPAITGDRVTAPVAESHPIPVCDGVPVLDEHLRWPGTPVHLVGRPAMLRLGPASGNLWGARMAARLIASHLAGSDPGEPEPVPLMGRGWCGPVWA